MLRGLSGLGSLRRKGVDPQVSSFLAQSSWDERLLEPRLALIRGLSVWSGTWRNDALHSQNAKAWQDLIASHRQRVKEVKELYQGDDGAQGLTDGQPAPSLSEFEEEGLLPHQSTGALELSQISDIARTMSAMVRGDEVAPQKKLQALSHVAENLDREARRAALMKRHLSHQDRVIEEMTLEAEELICDHLGTVEGIWAELPLQASRAHAPGPGGNPNPPPGSLQAGPHRHGVHGSPGAWSLDSLLGGVTNRGPREGFPFQGLDLTDGLPRVPHFDETLDGFPGLEPIDEDLQAFWRDRRARRSGFEDPETGETRRDVDDESWVEVSELSDGLFTGSNNGMPSGRDYHMPNGGELADGLPSGRDVDYGLPSDTEHSWPEELGRHYASQGMEIMPLGRRDERIGARIDAMLQRLAFMRRVVSALKHDTLEDSKASNTLSVKVDAKSKEVLVEALLDSGTFSHVCLVPGGRGVTAWEGLLARALKLDMEERDALVIRLMAISRTEVSLASVVDVLLSSGNAHAVSGGQAAADAVAVALSQEQPTPDCVNPSADGDEGVGSLPSSRHSSCPSSQHSSPASSQHGSCPSSCDSSSNSKPPSSRLGSCGSSDVGRSAHHGTPGPGDGAGMLSSTCGEEASAGCADSQSGARGGDSTGVHAGPHGGHVDSESGGMRAGPHGRHTEPERGSMDVSPHGGHVDNEERVGVEGGGGMLAGGSYAEDYCSLPTMEVDAVGFQDGDPSIHLLVMEWSAGATDEALRKLDRAVAAFHQVRNAALDTPVGVEVRGHLGLLRCADLPTLLQQAAEERKYSLSVSVGGVRVYPEP